MAKAKLKYILNDQYGYGKTAFYEYRGYEYMIHFCNNGCMDDLNVGQVHKDEQAKIDYKIEHKDDVVVNKPGTFDADAIWKLLEMEV